MHLSLTGGVKALGCNFAFSCYLDNRPRGTRNQSRNTKGGFRDHALQKNVLFLIYGGQA